MDVKEFIALFFTAVITAAVLVRGDASAKIINAGGSNLNSLAQTLTTQGGGTTGVPALTLG